MSSMASIRSTVLIALCAAVWPGPQASAEPVVFHNSSYIFGAVSMLQNGVPITIGQWFDTALNGPHAPLTGSWILSDARAIAEPGGSASVASSVQGSLTPTRFVGSGLTVGAASSDPAQAEAGARSWARSVFNVSFEVFEPTSFTYAGHYFADSDSLFAGVVGRLETAAGPAVFSDRFAFFPGSLDETRRYSGLLAPGAYSLILVSDPLYVDAPAQTRKRGGFDFVFDLSTSAPIPEPATIVLVGAGLAGLTRGALRGVRRSRRTARRS